MIAAVDPVAATDPRLLLWEDGALSVYYAPWDWVNTSAKVMLVGITPGAYQATKPCGKRRPASRRPFQ